MDYLFGTRKQKQHSKGRVHIPSIRSLSRKVCPPGQIERKAFTRRYSTVVRKEGFLVKRKTGTTYRVYPKMHNARVAPKCVKDRGLPGKGPKTFGPLRKGELTKHGYHFRMSEPERHKSVRSAVAEFGALGVFRKLDAVAKLTVHSLPNASKIYASDRDWVRVTFGPLQAQKKNLH